MGATCACIPGVWWTFRAGSVLGLWEARFFSRAESRVVQLKVVCDVFWVFLGLWEARFLLDFSHALKAELSIWQLCDGFLVFGLMGLGGLWSMSRDVESWMGHHSWGLFVPVQPNLKYPMWLAAKNNKQKKQNKKKKKRRKKSIANQQFVGDSN